MSERYIPEIRFMVTQVSCEAYKNGISYYFVSLTLWTEPTGCAGHLPTRLQITPEMASALGSWIGQVVRLTLPAGVAP